jgi:hypothetical protein
LEKLELISLGLTPALEKQIAVLRSMTMGL